MATVSGPRFVFHADVVVRFSGLDGDAAGKLTEALTDNPDVRDALGLLQETAAAQAKAHAEALGLDPADVSVSVRNLNA